MAGLGEHLLREAQGEVSAPGELGFTEVRTFEEYQRYSVTMKVTLEARWRLENLLCLRSVPFSYVGFDPCVGRATSFLVDLQYASPCAADGRLIPNYRERVVSALTGLNSRQRAVALAIERLLSGISLEDAAIYATEAVTSFFDFLRRRAPHTVGSEFLGLGIQRGSAVNGVRHEDVTQLTFGDRTFDLAVCLDVLEHVPSYRAGLRELLRVLKPGGALLLSVPFLREQYEHVVRARVGASGIEHLLPPEYHGDPVNRERGILCFQTFGWRLLDEMRELGYADAGAMFVWSYVHGILGDNTIFFGRKAA